MKPIYNTAPTIEAIKEDLKYPFSKPLISFFTRVAEQELITLSVKKEANGQMDHLGEQHFN